MKKICLLLLICTFSLGAIATSTPSGDKERSRQGEVSPGMATPSSATLQGELTDEMLAEETMVQAESSLVTQPSKARKAPVALRKADRMGKSKKESRFLKRVEKVRNRIMRRGDEGGSAVMGVLALVFGIMSFFALIAAAIAAVAAASLGWAVLALSGVFGLLAIVLGAVAMGGSDTSKAFGTAGLIVGIVGSAVFLLVLMIALLVASL